MTTQADNEWSRGARDLVFHGPVVAEGESRERPCMPRANFDSLLTLMFTSLHRAHHHHHGHAGRWGGLRTL